MAFLLGQVDISGPTMADARRRRIGASPSPERELAAITTFLLAAMRSAARLGMLIRWPFAA
jgi:hypothetical protein